MVTPKPLAAAFLLASAACAWAAEFNRDIRPVLSDRCLSCHGPDHAAKGIRLRLDREEMAKADLGGGKRGIVPGSPEQSLIVQRIGSENKALRMPPAHTGSTVSAAEKALIEEWIRDGAKWEKHWSFIPPRKAMVPAGQNAIDYFVRARLAKEGLHLSPAADQATLIRRVSLDLTGLPPQLNEKASYEKLVDRLLASPPYGERMAIRWLDAARYADTNGYQTDAERIMWRWRDWVIDAFNANMPFDRFVTEQIAGDLLPNVTRSQRIATGFSRNHRGNSEGGIVPEEYLVEYAADRSETMSTVFLGLTVGCARCHNHKYDPITQKEYYQLFAYFNNIGDPGRYLKYGNSPPFVAAPTPEQEHELTVLTRAAAEAKRRFQAMEPKMAAAQSDWEKSLNGSAVWYTREGLDSELPLGEPLTGNNVVEAGEQARFGFMDSFTIGFRMTSATGEGVVLHRMQDSENYPEGYGVNLENGKLQVHLAVRRLDDAILVQTKNPLEKNRPYHVAITYDGSRYASGLHAYLDGVEQELDVPLDALNQDFKRPGKLVFGGGGGWPSKFTGVIEGFRSYNRAMEAGEVAELATRRPLPEIAKEPKRTRAEDTLMRHAFLETAATPEMRSARNAVKETGAALLAFERSIPSVMTMEERPDSGGANILIRGAYDKPGEKVSRGVLSALNPMPAGAPQNRLGLAQWLTASDNPLTARVMVNRVWQMAFGTGLVKTAEDFGSQGDLPTHPELLDWLAVDFVESGWDLKRLWKTIVMSETYRQSSRIADQLRERDPENRLLARGPRLRLPAEMVRDQALAASGLLTKTVGGPSVKPYQPAGLWNENGGGDYKRSTGPDLYRRSVYTFWRRTSPPPFMATFDSALRESCTVREGRTNTPLQALHLMNDEQFLEAARALAQRAIREGGSDRLGYAFRLVLARPPRPKESETLNQMLAYSLDRFRTQPKSADEFLKQGDSPRDTAIDPVEHAAWMTVASMILNLDAAVTKE